MIAAGWFYSCILCLAIIIDITDKGNAHWQRLLSLLFNGSLVIWIFKAIEVLK